jgi:hypothetical protein
MMAHEMVLMCDQVAELETVIAAATRRGSHKTKRVQKEGTLTLEDGV